MDTKSINPKIDLSECDKEPIHLLGKIQSHGVLLAFHKVTRQLTYMSSNAQDVFKDLELKSTTLVEYCFDEDVCKFYDKIKNEKFYNYLYDSQVEINQKQYLLFFSNAIDYIVIELEEQERKISNYESFNTFKTISQNIKECNSLENLANTTTSILKEFTGFDRIMIYQFDERGDGEVIAEDKSFGLESFLGLKYPASDIPKQARKLYLTNLSRAINDVNDDGLHIHHLNNHNTPIDLSYSVYRSVSPVHIQYLQNMGVTSTHVVSIVVDNELWGMLICHHYSGSKYLNFNLRFLLELIAGIFSNQVSLQKLESLKVHQDKQNEILYNINYHNKNEGFDVLLKEHWAEISKQIESCGFTVFDKRKQAINFGITPNAEDSKNIHDLIQANYKSNIHKNIFYSDSIKSLINNWQEEDIAGHASLVFSNELGLYIHFWRKAKEKVVNWAGSPEKAMAVDKSGDRIILTPRASFALWKQKEKDKSLPWRPYQKIFIEKLFKLFVRKEFDFIKNIFDENDRLTSSGKKLQSLVEKKSIELTNLNHQLKKELKANKEYQTQLEIALKTGEEINALKSKVLSNVSHEIRTPISSIIGITKIFLQEDNLNESQKELVELTLESAERLLDTVDRILVSSKLEESNTPVHIEKIDVVKLTNQIIENFKIKASEKDINLVFLCKTKEIFVYTDQHYYRQALRNLINNAIRFTPKKGRIEVTLKLLREDGINQIFLSVEDNGVGIANENLEKIFEPYYTIKDSTFQADKSTGLGLYIVKNNMTLLGGNISVESKKDVGSRFKILIPSKDE